MVDEGSAAETNKAMLAMLANGPKNDQTESDEPEHVEDDTTDDVDDTPEFKPITEQAELDRLLKVRLAQLERKHAAELAPLRKELDTRKRAEMTETQRNQAEREAETARADTAEQALARFTVARDEGVLEWADLLSGTRDEMTAQAAVIKERLANAGKPRTPAPDRSQGQGRAPMSTGEQFAAAVKGQFTS